jgi:hypothetical protein
MERQEVGRVCSSGATSGEPSGSSVAASRRSALLLRFRTTISLPGTVRSRLLHEQLVRLLLVGRDLERLGEPVLTGGVRALGRAPAAAASSSWPRGS